MPKRLRKFFRDPRTSFNTAVTVMSVIVLTCGVPLIVLILWDVKHR